MSRPQIQFDRGTNQRDVISSEIIATIREMRVNGATLAMIAQTTGTHQATVRKYTGDIPPPNGARSWQQASFGGGRAPVPSKITLNGDGTASVDLGRGFFAIIDADDIDKVSNYRWHVHQFSKNGVPLYASTSFKLAKSTMMHHLICPVRPGYEVDHKDRNTLNNRRVNLREASDSNNSSNKVFKPGKSGYVGVRLCKKTQRWEARILFQGERHYLGSFVTAEEAAVARDEACRRFRGEFAVLNFPEAQS